MSIDKLSYTNSGTGKEVEVSDAFPLPVTDTENKTILEVIQGYLEPNSAFETVRVDHTTPPAGDYPVPATTLGTLRKVMISNEHATEPLIIKNGDLGVTVVIVQPKTTELLDFPATGLFADVGNIGVIQAAQSITYIGIA